MMGGVEDFDLKKILGGGIVWRRKFYPGLGDNKFYKKGLKWRGIRVKP